MYVDQPVNHFERAVLKNVCKNGSFGSKDRYGTGTNIAGSVEFKLTRYGKHELEYMNIMRFTK